MGTREDQPKPTWKEIMTAPPEPRPEPPKPATSSGSESSPKTPPLWWGVVLLCIVMFAFLLYEHPYVAPPPQPPTWCEHADVYAELALKKTRNDPSSFEKVSSSASHLADRSTDVTILYRDKNLFGALMLREAIVKVDTSCAVTFVSAR